MGDRVTTASDGICRAVVPGRILAAAGDEGTEGKPAGYLKALISAYGVKYRIGWRTWHTIEFGAASASLAAQGAMLPWFWMHGWDAFIGTADLPVGDGRGWEDEAEGGLVTEGAIFLDEDPTLGRLHTAAKNRSIREWSIGYRVLAQRVDPDDEDHYFVTELEILEGSLVLRGANPQTDTLAASGLDLSAPGAARLTLPSGAVVETADADLIHSLAGGANVPASAGPSKPAGADDDLTDESEALRLRLLSRPETRAAFGR